MMRSEWTSRGLVALALMVGLARAQCPESGDSSAPAAADTDNRKTLYQGQQVFTLNLFNAINKAVPDDNIFFSPFSVYHGLLLAYFSASGQTEADLKSSLQLSQTMNKRSTMLAYSSDKLQRANNNASDSYEFISANKLFAEKDLKVRDCMLQFFGSELETLNLREKPMESRQHINDWVAKTTKNQIMDLLPEDAISSNTKLVLANAAYFKGVWASQFLSERTKKEPFFVSETRQTLVPFMKQKGNFHYMVSDELGAQILELPYKGHDISMYIFLPPYSMKEGVTNIIAKLTPERLAAVVEENFMAKEVIVEIPKFTMERELPLRTVLETLGVGDLFNSSANFKALSDDEGIAFDDAVHKAKIQISEEGTTAAAATAIFGFRSSRPVEPTRFTANFPFVYVIYDKPTASVLFMGVYRDPKK